jgi:hypothetical protein
VLESQWSCSSTLSTYTSIFAGPPTFEVFDANISDLLINYLMRFYYEFVIMEDAISLILRISPIMLGIRSYWALGVFSKEPSELGNLSSTSSFSFSP